jgi:hypothetical protein
MQQSLNAILQHLKNKYGDDVLIEPPASNDKKITLLPDALRQLYQLIGHAEFPFGRVYSLDKALEMSERLPFKPNWLAFGQDNYFSFWLRAVEKESNGLCITSWDHESRTDIEAAFLNMADFFKDMADEYDENLADRWDEEDDYDEDTEEEEYGDEDNPPHER